ncbi:hypothetical protein COL13_27360 [Bacillus cereus]|nr:hypothetical protein COL13_27360 [Bacillus cereus]
MISILCGLKKIIVNNDLVIGDDLNIIKNPLEIEEIRDENLFNTVGSNYYGSLVESPVLLQRILCREDEIDPYKVIQNFRGYFQHFLMSIWFVKDNSISLSDVMFINENKEVMYFDRNPLLFSNSKGEYKSVYLTSDETKEALKWLELLAPLVIRGISSEKKEDSSVGTRLNNNNKNFDYYNFNRLQRALRFVALARSESFPPAKITFYISALECLFSNSKTEVRMQVADRTTRVLSDVFEERTRINKIISIAYEFRSSYIHGSVNNQKTIKKALKPYETIEELSFELDDILRKVLKRFLTDLNHVVHMDGAAFSVWISQLLYK